MRPYWATWYCAPNYIKDKWIKKKEQTKYNIEEWKDMDLSRRNNEVLYGKVEFSMEILIQGILNEAVYVVFTKISGPLNLMTQPSYSPVTPVLCLKVSV